MLPSDCPFCDHKNPAGAKFCNECGSPLNLVPCKRCGAINNLLDAECQRCGAVLLQPRSPAEPPQAQAAFARSDGESGTLEQDLALIEEGLRELGHAPGTRTLPDAAAAGRVKQGAPESARVSDDSTLPGVTVTQVKQGAPELAQVPHDSTLPGDVTVARVKQGAPELAQVPDDSTLPGDVTVAQVKQGVPELAQAPGASTLPNGATVARVEDGPRKPVRKRGAKTPFAGPATPPLRVPVDARWQELLGIALFVGAIAGGGYLSYRLSGLPVREAFTAWLGSPQVGAPSEPRAASDAPPVGSSGGTAATPSPAPPVAPRAASDAPAIGTSGGAAAAPSPTPRAIVTPQEPGVASGVPQVPAKGPTPAAAPPPACPPAVTAMALCHAYRP